MIDVESKKKGDIVWIINKNSRQLLTPLKCEFDSIEDNTDNKVLYVIINNKKICYTTRSAFNTEKEAILYAAIYVMKQIESGEPFVEGIDDHLLEKASKICEHFKIESPEKFIYYWMSNV